MMEQFSVIRKHLKKKLDPRRFEHTLGVEFTCAALAMRYGYDIKKAQLAGLLHDCAKRYPGPELLRRCLEREIPVTPAEEADPSLLHAKLGAWMAKEKYGVEDEEILEAIRCHTTGKPGMSLLDKLLYVADYIEPERDTAPELTQFRKMAFIDLDEACLAMMKANLEYLRESGRTIDPMPSSAASSAPPKETISSAWSFNRKPCSLAARRRRRDCSTEKTPCSQKTSQHSASSFSRITG